MKYSVEMWLFPLSGGVQLGRLCTFNLQKVIAYTNVKSVYRNTNTKRDTVA